METVDEIIDSIIAEEYGFDNKPALINPKKDAYMQLKAYDSKPVLSPHEHKKRMKLYHDIKSGKYDNFTNPNTPVKPKWLDDEKMSPETLRKWNKYYPNDEEIAKKIQEFDEYTEMLKLNAADEELYKKYR